VTNPVLAGCRSFHLTDRVRDIPFRRNDIASEQGYPDLQPTYRGLQRWHEVAVIGNNPNLGNCVAWRHISFCAPRISSDFNRSLSKMNA
jgi:hypothetical protein